jgi:hypothetical protein
MPILATVVAVVVPAMVMPGEVTPLQATGKAMVKATAGVHHTLHLHPKMAVTALNMVPMEEQKAIR